MSNHFSAFSLQKGIFVMALLFLVLAACASAPTAPVAPTPEPAHLKVGLQPFIGYAPIFIAYEEGYFAGQGIEVEFIPVNSSSEALPSLMQGQLDMLLVAVNPGFFNAIAGSNDVRVVLGGSRLRQGGCAPTGVAARKAEAEKLRNTANWKGLTLSTSPTGLPGISGFWLDHALALGGLSLSDINVTKLPPASTAEALQSGAVDLVEMTEPWITRAIVQGNAEMVSAAQDVVPDAQLSLIIFGPGPLQSPDLGNRVALAYLQGLRQYQLGNTDRNVEILAKYTQLEPELLRQICWSVIPADGSVNLDNLAEFQAWAVKQGYMDKVVDKALFWDGQFLEQAQREIKNLSQQ